MKKISGIYKISSIIKPERCYIGSALNIYKRWATHITALKGLYHHSTKLQRHFNKYGNADLQFSILLGCEIEDLIGAEQYFIDSHNPYFNECKIAGSVRGRKASDETRLKMSLSRKGEKNSMYGTTWNENQKKGSQKPKSEEAIKNMSLGQQKRFEREEERIRMGTLRKGKSSWIKGKHHSEESNRKNSLHNLGKIAWNKGKKATEEHIRKLTESRRKRPLFSEETKRRISESNKKAWELRKLKESIKNQESPLCN